MLYAPNYYGAGAPTDSPGITTLLSRITGLIQTKAQSDADKDEVLGAIDAVPTVAEMEARTLPSADYMPASGYTPPDNLGISAIKAKTDTIPANPAAVGDEMAASTASVQAGMANTNDLLQSLVSNKPPEAF